MEIKVKRTTFTDRSTIGEMTIDGVFFCYTLEDEDRKLETGGLKVYGETCIPRGKYNLVMSFSNRFKRYLPEIQSVPQFLGIRIHAGNTDADSHGCILLGVAKGIDNINKSKIAVANFIAVLKKVEKKEKITIEIV